jgi:TusA-related sulfurtransferase
MAQDKLQEDKLVDTRGQLCPMPVIAAKLAANALASGKVLKLVASDPGSLADIPAWAESSGHHLLKQEKENGVFTFWVKKK